MPTDIKSSVLYDKALGCLMMGLIGDAMGTPSEGKNYKYIEEEFGWIDDFSSDGTDDTVMKDLLAEALIRSDGLAGIDEWAGVLIEKRQEIFGEKVGKFFQSVLHTADKLRRGFIPRKVALGNMPSSSSAMCISPVGIANACDPREAAVQAYALGALIHVYDAGFCQDGAAAMAATVAEAFKPDATVDSIVDAATKHLQPISGTEMRERIEFCLAIAEKRGEYKAFRTAMYDVGDEFFCRYGCDSRETIPLTVALFKLSEGDMEKGVQYSANFGHDADTIATMCGAIAGTLHGAKSIRQDWVDKVHEFAATNQEQMAQHLAETALKKVSIRESAQSILRGISK